MGGGNGASAAVFLGRHNTRSGEVPTLREEGSVVDLIVLLLLGNLADLFAPRDHLPNLTAPPLPPETSAPPKNRVLAALKGLANYGCEKTGGHSPHALYSGHSRHK